MNGISSVTDSPRPGQAHPVMTPEGIAAVEAFVNENRRVTVNEMAAHLDMSHGSAYHIVRDFLQFHKVFNKLQDNKYLEFPFDSASYITIINLMCYNSKYNNKVIRAINPL
jgi:phosphoribosylaminoimidazole carboxylase (NCAIR synthetase)